ncbi:C_GCAxxG_C_C family protein [Candidatus Bathyarchaeota archaeon]|nr:C_GCAxxG_C_C family protein [Candidatus Bathyarchaeota archaeon]
MISKQNLGKKASSFFLKGFNCSQSVLLTMLEHWGIKDELVPKIATGFGGGIGRCGSLCGALTGGIMALGVKFGTSEPSAEKRLQTYEVSRRFYKEFEKRNGSVLCRKLIVYNLSDPIEYEKARNDDVFQKKCVEYVKTAVMILLEMTEEKSM